MIIHSNKKESTAYRDKTFVQLLLQVGLPEPESEYRFSKDRMWRFDFAYPESRLAIEIEGGVWNQGRHVTGTGFEEDCNKYNTAALLGWYVFRIPTKFLFKKTTFEMLKECYLKNLRNDVPIKQRLF